ncbi:MAG: hypothetical protein V7L00_10795 [Nostoc sp.]|uniref:hypothetical protein n=1 Tax=Nostoc sp. TaxID=1180 RepID=UPI002FFA8892
MPIPQDWIIYLLSVPNPNVLHKIIHILIQQCQKADVNPSHFSRMNSAHFSDVICIDKTARYEHLRTFAEKSYVFITGFVQQFS